MSQSNFFAMLSRMMNHFFSARLPECIAAEFPNIYVLFAGGDDLIDYDTGRILNSRDSGDLQDERTYTRETELAGENGSFSVQVSEQARCSWDKWEFVQNKDRVAAANRAVVEAVLTVRAPEDYDGLALGLDVNNAEKIPDDPFAEDAAPAEVPELWDASAGDWVFVRASEWIDGARNEPENQTEEPDEKEPEETPEDSAEEESPDETDGEIEEAEEEI